MKLGFGTVSGRALLWKAVFGYGPDLGARVGHEMGFKKGSIFVSKKVPKWTPLI